MAHISQRTVLFADLRGSTALYERLGNAEATTVVTQSVAALGQAVRDAGGTVVKTLGDGLMAMFEMPGGAVQAADDMHERLARTAPRGNAQASAAGSAPLRMPPLKLQVALAHGEIVEMAGDCFGDAVNVAARLLGHAGDNETLATVSVLQGLNLLQRNRFRSLERMQLRGRSEPVHVYLLESRRQQEDLAPSTLYGELAPSLDPEGIRLVWMDSYKVFSGPSMPVVLGRSPQATYCIDDSRVSRSHARIDWHGGAFQLTDLSYNGTYVRFDNDENLVSLRRGTCTLHGAGVIGLGSAPVDATSPSLRFEVMRFTETLPQEL